MAIPLLKGPFTVDSYHRLGELGVFRPGDRTELIHGQVVEMSPIGDRHAHSVRRLNQRLSRALRDQAMVDVQNPSVLDDHNVPQPDVVVLKSRADGYPKHPRPADILLLIEAADSSLAYDRDVKVPLYAAAGIPETWLVNLPDECIEVFRSPGAEGYGDFSRAVSDVWLSPLAFPNVSLSVRQILD